MGRSQFVSIEGVNSQTKIMDCGVPQGSVLGPLLFLIFINDLPSSIDFFTLLFADDTTLQISGSNLEELFAKANHELLKAQSWFQANRLTLNVKKTKFILFRTKSMAVNPSMYSLKLDGKAIDRIGTNCTESSFKFVGHYLDEFLSWDNHIKHVSSKLSSANYAIWSSKNFLPYNIRKTLYNTLFKSHLEFEILAKSKLKKIITLQKKCIRHVSNKEFRAHSAPLFYKLSILTFEDLFDYNINCFMHQYSTGKLPPSFSNMFTLIRNTDELNVRDSFYNFSVSIPLRKGLANFPRSIFIPIWNSLPSIHQCTVAHKEFKTNYKKDILAKYAEFESCDNLSCMECRY